MVEIECLVCGKGIKPRQLNDTENYDTENYDGQIVCQECKSLLYVKLVKGELRKYKIVERYRPGEPVKLHVVYDNDKKAS